MLHRPSRRVLVVGLAFLVVPWCAIAQEIVVRPVKAGGVFDVGEKIEWTVEAKGTPKIGKATYALKMGGYTVVMNGELDLAAGPVTVDARLDEPGTMLLEVKARPADKEVKGLGGAAVAPERIKPSMPPPDDFDAFWKAKVEQLKAVPPNVKLQEADGGKEGVDYYKITMDNIAGSHIYGQLAKPKKGGKFPAMLIVQYASVYPLQKQWATNRAAQGWLVLNIMAHDLPIDEPAEFYKKASATTLKDYVGIGDEDRETSYFLRMYLSCYRAADYLAAREDWDGKTLVVTGGSQGGQQSIVTAGMHPKVTAMVANVPAGCDVTGHEVGRAIGFPYWAARAEGKKKPQIVGVGRYFDAMNFAPKVTCPALVGLGLIDETCPPSGVYAAVNQFKGPKEIVVLPLSDHMGRNNSQAAYYGRSEAWFKKLVKGEDPLAK
jgi:cephalosporin-C deacetylase-like acetyl esterase